MDGRSEGSNHLIREGATLVRDIDDILECLARPPVASLPTAKEWRGAQQAVECRRVLLTAAACPCEGLDDARCRDERAS